MEEQRGDSHADRMDEKIHREKPKRTVEKFSEKRRTFGKLKK